MVEFVSYDGKYPNRCSGTLVLKIGGKVVEFPDYCMCSGGRTWIDSDGDDHVKKGPWSVNVPKEYEKYKVEIEMVVNENVPWGCCGGCI